MFEGRNAVELSEALKAFQDSSTNVINAIQVGIQPDNRAATARTTRAGNDPLAAVLINNSVANSAQVMIDPCADGRAKYYIQTPFVMSDTGLENTDADGEGCCVGLPSVTACNYKLDLNELCVKDCISTSLDEMLETAVKNKETDTRFPFRSVGESLAQTRARYVAFYTKFVFERNAILGTPEYSGHGLRPFNGLVSRLTDSRVLNIDGSAGFIAATEMLACRLAAMGETLSNYVIAVNPIAKQSLIQEVRTYLKSDPFTMWGIDANGNISYGRIRVIESTYVDVDLATNTTSMWIINTNKVGIKMVRSLSNPYIKPKDSLDDCGGHCITMHNAGSTVVTDWTGLVLVSNVHLNSICDSTSLSGLDKFVNAGVRGYAFPTAE